MNPARLLLLLLLQLCHVGAWTSEKRPGVNEKRDESIKNAVRELEKIYRKRPVKYTHTWSSYSSYISLSIPAGMRV